MIQDDFTCNVVLYLDDFTLFYKKKINESIFTLTQKKNEKKKKKKTHICNCHCVFPIIYSIERP